MSSATSSDRPAVDRLIDATLESIHRHGLGETTVTTVTELAGLSRGMVRHEFGTKHHLVVAAMTHLCDRWLAATEPDPTLSGTDQVRSIVGAMFAPEAFNAVEVDAWLALSVEARSVPELQALRARTQRRWVDQLRAAFQAGDVVDPHQAATATLALADGLWLQQRLDGETLDRDEAVAMALRVVESLLPQQDS